MQPPLNEKPVVKPTLNKKTIPPDEVDAFMPPRDPWEGGDINSSEMFTQFESEPPDKYPRTNTLSDLLGKSHLSKRNESFFSSGPRVHLGSLRKFSRKHVSLNNLHALQSSALGTTLLLTKDSYSFFKNYTTIRVSYSKKIHKKYGLMQITKRLSLRNFTYLLFLLYKQGRFKPLSRIFTRYSRLMSALKSKNFRNF